MKIGIDSRYFSKLQNKFFEEFVEIFTQKNENDTINIYDEKVNNKLTQNLFGEQTLFLQQLLKDKNDILISFEQTFPILYNSRVIQIIPSLENILYPDLSNTKFFRKYSTLFTIKNSLKKSYKIICFNKKTKEDINEKLNISEDKIEVISPFFPASPKESAKIDIKAKHSITGDYIIYDSETGNNKNLKRFLESISEINKDKELNIIFIGNKIASDIEVRELVIRLGLTEKIVFAGIPADNELGLYYKQSIGVIYPTIYDSFPFSLANAINYETPIIASDLDEIRNIFGDSISYFSPISVISIKNEIINLTKKKKTPNYKDILEKYSKENFALNLTSLIK